LCILQSQGNNITSIPKYKHITSRQDAPVKQESEKCESNYLATGAVSTAAAGEGGVGIDEAEVREGGAAPGARAGVVGDEHTIHDEHIIVSRLRPQWRALEEEAPHVGLVGELGVDTVAAVEELRFV
jgi:hypothetical protein